MSALSTAEILDRARARGDYADIEQAAEAEVAAEQAATEAAATQARVEAEAVLAEARQACKHDEDTYFKHCSKIPALQAKGRASRERYKAAQRVVRGLGVTETDPLLPLGTGSYEHRKQAEAITLAFRRGL